MKRCLNCKKEIKNPKFCSRSCAATYNNSVKPKRSVEGSCKKCLAPISKKHKLCKKCRHGVDMTLKQAVYEKHHKSSAFALVRTRARAVMKNELQICSKCKYDKHVQVCHIIPISEFDDNTLISRINRKDNLMLLCPNCHWELDHLST